MKIRRKVALLWPLLILGCTHDPGLRYVAIVESVEDESATPTEGYSLGSGRVPMTTLGLRLVQPARTGGPKYVRVTAMGLRRHEDLGRTGDVVAFSYSGPSLQGGEVPLDQLADYRVVQRQGPEVQPDSGHAR